MTFSMQSRKSNARWTRNYLGEAVMTHKDTRYPELNARLIQEFLDSR
jgi:hypothetical protein